MRALAVLTLFMGVLVATQAAPRKTKPLTPVEAIKKVNEHVTVQMLVKATKNALAKRGEIYLDSEEDFRDEKNLGVVVTKDGAARFKEAGVADPAVHFKDKLIRVDGKMMVKDGRPRIEVYDPKQIRIIEKDSKK